MKGRSVSLKETHKSNGISSFCSILWDHQANHIITASDCAILIHHQLPSSSVKPPSILRHHKSAVTALALSPDSKCLASGSVDHSVKLYAFPGGEFQSNVTRFTLPIRSLTFNQSGSLLAAAGDDEGIKLISTIDSSITRVLKAHKGPVTGLAFDCKDEYLASVDGFGTVIYWELSSGKSIHTLKIAPNSGLDTTIVSGLGWSPDGEMLAVAGLKNDVVMYDRDTAEKLFSLKGGHEQSVCFLSWSPNGKYMATSGLDKQVLIWDLDQRQDIDRQKFDDRICCLAWKPNGNALAVVDVMGKFGVWEPAVPSHMKSPTDGALTFRTRVSDEFLVFDEEEQEPSASGSLDQVGEDSNGESALISRKRLRKKPVFNDDSDKDSGSEKGFLRQLDSHKNPPGKYTEHVEDRNEEVESLVKPGRPKTKMQDAFQPGATPVQSGKRRFLCYNMLGSITTLENDGFSHIEVDFHDTGRGPRVPSMTDYFGFTMASLNEAGSVFANPYKGEKNTSTLMYRPFSSWANNSEWSMRFEAEEVKAVALGVGWVAAVTSLNFLRIFSEGGLQRCILSLEGPVVTAAGFKDQLVVITHASDCLPLGDQMLEFEVFNIPNGIRTLKGRLPLTPGSFLTWFGFSEEGRLSSYDSKGVLRVFTDQYGGSWLPLFSSSKERKSENENYWVVGLNSAKVFCVVCKSPDLYPLVMPKPVLTLLSLSCPLASSDLGADDLENEFMMSNLLLSQVQRKIEETAATGLDTSLDDEAFSIEAALDRCILRLIGSCCKGDKLVRATELAKLLSLEKSLKGAIKLVTAMKLPILAERLNGILEERLLNESEEATMPANPAPNSSLLNCVDTQTALHVAENVTKWTPAVQLPPPQLPSPVFSKKEKAEEKLDIGAGKIESDRNGSEGKKKAESNRVLLQGPSNPFAKVSNNQEKSSLFDSIKKMKVENGSKDKEGVEGKRKEKPGVLQHPKSKKQTKK